VAVDDPSVVSTVHDAVRAVVVPPSPADENGFVLQVGSGSRFSVLLDRSGFVLARRRNLADLVTDLAALVESLVSRPAGRSALAVRAVARAYGLVVAPMPHVPTIVDARRALSRRHAALLPTLRTLVDQNGRDEQGRPIKRFVYFDDPLRPALRRAERAAMLARAVVWAGSRRDVLELSVNLADQVEFRRLETSALKDVVDAFVGD